MKHRRKLAAALAVAGAGLLTSGQSLAAQNSLTATVNITAAVRSVTVSTGTAATNNCYASNTAFVNAADAGTNGSFASGGSTSLGTPNGWCLSPSFEVTNGNASSHIDVSGSNATPVTGTGGWTLTQTATPGTDQFNLDTVSVQSPNAASPNNSVQDATGPSPACDTAFQNAATGSGPGCTATPDQQATEYIGIDGPSAQAAGDTATSESATVTWTAVP